MTSQIVIYHHTSLHYFNPSSIVTQILTPLLNWNTATSFIEGPLLCCHPANFCSCAADYAGTIFPRIVSTLKQFPPLNSFRTFMYCNQRSQYIRPNSKKNSFRGNYMRKYGILIHDNYFPHSKPIMFFILYVSMFYYSAFYSFYNCFVSIHTQIFSFWLWKVNRYM